MKKRSLLQWINLAAREGAETLNLTDKGIAELPPQIGNLSDLTGLDLSGNDLATLPREIGDLTKLRYLRLYGSKVSTLPPEIGNLANLTHLLVQVNRLVTLPPEIGKLADLNELNLHGNNLSALPPEIGDLANLTKLNLFGNNLTTLPVEIGRLEKLEELHLEGNPLTDPPPEIVKQGTQAVLAYLRGRLEDTRRVWVSKMLVVGEGGVGKTCLLRALRGEPFDPHRETTHGIDVQPLEFVHPRERDVTMTLNCWDFGGQQIYHATHQFFLTNRSLFLVVWNARMGFEQGKLYYWLDTIEALAPESPVLLVATHIDERDADLPYENLKRKYPMIAARCAISNKKHEWIDELRDTIGAVAAGLPLMGEKWPVTWLDAAEDIRTHPDSRITADRLKTMMSEHHVEGIAKSVLARWLHELGDILYFADDKELCDTVLLSPKWVTDNISRVLECDDIIEGLGIFRHEHMAKVWKELEPITRDWFLRLMEKFDLSYRIPDDPENKSLVVERLSLDPPDYETRWEAILEGDGCKEISMKFDLQITRPAGIPTWFIARSHRFTTHTHWRYGALLTDPPDRRHLALAVAPPSERYVTVTVRGPSPQSFFALLKDGLELTLARFPGLKLKRTMPCPGHNGQPCEHEFDHAHLLRAIERQPPVKDIQCPVGFANVPVAALLFGIHWSTENAVLDRIDELERGDIERHAETMAELKGLRELSQREFTNLFKRDQRLAESHCPSVFSVRPLGRTSWVIPKKLRGLKWELQLYCEAPGRWHAMGEDGRYEIREAGEWVSTLAPHLSWLVRVFKFVAPLAAPWLAYAAPDYEKSLKIDIDLMQELVGKLPEIAIERELRDEALVGIKSGPRLTEGASLRGLRKLLDELDENQHWGGLKNVLTPEGHYLWLCSHHAKEYDR